MNERLRYTDPRQKSAEEDQLEPTQDAAVHHRNQEQSVNETEKPLNGWTDGQDSDVEALRGALERTNPQLLHQLDQGIDQKTWHPTDTEAMSTYLRVSLDYISEKNPDVDRQGAANAAAWAAFHQLHEDLENEAHFASPGNTGPVEKHNMKTFLLTAQTDYANAMGDPDLPYKEAIDKMKHTYQEALSVASGNAAPATNPD